MDRLVFCTVVAVVVVGTGCSGGSTPSGGSPDAGTGGTPTGTVEQVRQGAAAVVSQDARLAGTASLSPDDYDALATRLAAVPGVEAADYVGDTLGTVYVKVSGGGTLLYRHLRDDRAEADTLPAEADFANQLDPQWNPGATWQGAVTDSPLRAAPRSSALAMQNTYATHFPMASAEPDPLYVKDDAVTCPQEGKIAIVDFLWTEAHRDFPGLYADQYAVDGVMLYDRLKAMATAAGFTLDVFKDDEINLGNFTRLQDYTIVFTNGHGGRPGPRTAARLGTALPTLATPELYDPAKRMANGMTYEEGWKAGYLVYGVADKRISWTPWLFRDLYRPAVPQLVMLNECWSMLPFNIGLAKRDGRWVWDQGVTGPLYNFGKGLMDAGAKAVFGYVSPATPEAVVRNTVPFFRRLFGGYLASDVPPSRFPQTYWPTCMGAQTYFRLPNTPELKLYGNKYRFGSMYTMYAVDENTYLRKACAEGNHHAMLQDFMLRVGTPATAFQGCWDTWWSRGQDPSGIQDPLCSQGEPTASDQQTKNAACLVRTARKVTNAMLE